MTYAPTNPYDVPPYQVQPLITSVVENDLRRSGSPPVKVRCAQALGSEIYVGCSNGELLRFALQADDPNKLESYSLFSRQSMSNEKPIDEIVLVPSIARALILSEHQVHFYTLPSLDPVPIKPIRNVVTIAVDHQHLQRPPPSSSDPPSVIAPIEFSVIKRSNIALYSLREKLFYQKEIPLPQGATLARRSGRALCVADKANYNMIDLELASLIPLFPLSQAPDRTVAVKPSITVINETEFLILSWTGASTIGVFINSDGDPVRGTLEWPAHPQAVCLDYPYITALLPNDTIEIHNLETQSIVQVLSSPPTSPSTAPSGPDRSNLATCLNGYMVPSTERSDKMRMTSVPLIRRTDIVADSGAKGGDNDEASA